MVDLHKLKLDRIDKGFTQADKGDSIFNSLKLIVFALLANAKNVSVDNSWREKA